MLKVAQNNVSFFLTMAQIAATLLGLSFLALTFYLQAVFDRSRLSLPVYRYEDRYQRVRLRSRRFASVDDRDRSNSAIRDSMLDFPGGEKTGSDVISLQRNPLDLTDLQIFDGDPLVVFLAFSTAVSWNLYFLSLVVSVTFVGWNPIPVWVVAVETLGFFLLIAFSNLVRHRQYVRMRTYRTRDERLTPILEWLALSAYFVIVLYCCWGAFGWSVPASVLDAQTTANLTLQMHQAFTPILQIVCLLAFSGGLYVTNKDLFVFFKARVSDNMRGRWLEQFASSYADLLARVSDVLSRPGDMTPEVRLLSSRWNGGRPPTTYFATSFGIPSELQWSQLTQRESWKTIAPWMVDVPAIAAWLQDVEHQLDDLQASPRSK